MTVAASISEVRKTRSAVSEPRQLRSGFSVYLRSLLLLLRLGPLAVVFRHLNLNCRVAWLYGERVGVDSLFSHAAPAATAEPVAIGNKHELRTSPESPVALGRNEAHQELVPRLEGLLRPAIGERVSGTYCFDAPGLLFARIILQGEINLDMGIGPYVLRDCRLRSDAMSKVIHARGSMMREQRGINRQKAKCHDKKGNYKLTRHLTSP